MSSELSVDARTERGTRQIRRAGRTSLILAGILALGLTAGCGKKNDPEPPGPNPTYPKTYPSS